MIEVKPGEIRKLRDTLTRLTANNAMDQKTDLEDDTIVDLNNLFSSKEMLSTLNKVKEFNKQSPFSYEQLCEVEESLNSVYGSLKYIKEKVELDIFFKDGYTLDIKKVKQKFNAKGLKKRFPKFNFKRLDELYKTPPKTLKTNYNDDEIMIDDYVFRKYMIGIIQMVLDHMDIVSVVTGNEGSGKSTHVSQIMYMVHWIISELQIVEYEFNIKDMFFNNLEALRLKEDDLFEQPFRILALDEGNELHRQNWKDEEVATFFQRLRRERFNQRIKFICIPVLGELISNVVLTRVNFIIEMVNTNDLKTGSLNKGTCNFYIIPRGDKIYSPLQRREISKGEIRTTLYENLKDKNYLTGIPQGCLIKTYRCNGVWGFPESLYIKELKDTNKIFKVSGGFKLTDTEAFYLYMSRISLKAQGLTTKDIKYAMINKTLNRLKNYFENDPDKFNKYNLVLQRKQEEKDIKALNK